ncbi:MAG: T9SS type A sorting domain-containing protein [Crocinitomicaceae bacterium]|nr:T9SS type A sorting domain-containing protein [Crocinitomicaceae bacterium]
MKRKILLLCLIVVSSTSWSQNDLKLPTMDELLSEGKQNLTQSLEKDLGITIWSDNFDDPATWTINNDGLGGVGYGWDINDMSEGWWSSNGINSSSGGNFAELSNGDATANSQELDVILTMTTTDPIDVIALGGTNQVTLEFEQFGARFNDLQQISISTDGTTFTPVGDNLDKSVLSQSGGSPYDNPDLKQINLGTILTPTNDPIWIRFTWTTNYPSASTNPNVWITYGWYIDDVKLVTNPDNDLEVTDSYWGTEGLHYYRIPTTQVAPIDFQASVFNGGVDAQTNVQLNADINSGVFTGSSDPLTVEPLDTTDLILAIQFTPPASVMNYTVTQTITADSTDDVPSNNELSNIAFYVTDYTYARDNNEASGSTTNGTDGFEVGNLFDIWNDQELKALSVQLPGGNNGATVGTEFFLKLYSLDPNSTGSIGDALIYEEETEPIIVTTSMLNQTVTFPLNSPVFLTANTTYLAVAGSYTEGLRVSNAGASDPQTSFFLDLADGTWYYTNSTPIVRMDFDPTIGLNENALEMQVGTIFPNPASDEARVRINLMNSSGIKIHVSDLYGKTLSVQDLNAQSGQNEFFINTESFASGVYCVHVFDGLNTITRKFTKK